MKYTEKEINTILQYSKYRIDRITQKQNFPKKIKELNYLIFAGLLAFYGIDVIYDIEQLFFLINFRYTTNTLFEEKSIQEFMKENFKNETRNIPSIYLCNIRDMGNSQIRIRKSIYISNHENLALGDLLDLGIHEVNHGMNSLNKPVLQQYQQFFVRSGVKLRGINCERKEGSCLEESWNTLQSAEIKDTILSFTQYPIENRKLKYLIDQLKEYPGTKGNNFYAEIVPYIKPLYEQEEIRTFVKEKRLSGDIYLLKKYFDEKMGTGQYNNLSKELDLCYYSRNKEEQLEHANKVKSIVQQYRK